MFSHIFVGISDFDRALMGKPRDKMAREHHAHDYGAYFRDPDGNKLCVVCHAPQE